MYGMLHLANMAYLTEDIFHICFDTSGYKEHLFWDTATSLSAHVAV